jgi:putative transposase
VRPAPRRAAAAYVQQRLGFSQRRACRLVGTARSTVRYRGCQRDDEPLRGRLRELAAQRPRFGYRRLHVLLRREGIVVNHKRIERLYRAEGLAVRRRRRKAPTPVRRGRPPAPAGANEQWAMDFLHDTVASGRTIRILSVIDVFTREALTLEVDTSLPGRKVVRVLDRLAGERPLPRQLVLDNGPELISRVLEQWAHEHTVTLHFIDPGKPIQNAHCESFHARLRDECLNEHWFLGLADARRIVEDWRHDYNRERPHSALGYQTPAEFAQRAATAAASLLADDGLS